jgi:tRNA 2-thiocytidine biosynthesis protein TtcA
MSRATEIEAQEPRMTPEKLARERHKLHKRLLRLTGEAIAHYDMIGEGDRVMVCLSGGKDSYALLDLLLTLRSRAPVGFEIIAVNLDQKQPGFPEDVLPAYLRALGVPFHIENQDTYSIVRRVIPEGRTMCSLCSRLRRGILYRVADELGATRIALGHHRDDILETFFLNMFFGGKLKTMPPRLVSDDGRHVVIRPLAYVQEADLTEYARWREFPIIPCNLCGSQENLKRREIKQLMREWEKRFPGRVENIFASLSRVVPSHLMDRELFDFAAARPTGEPQPDGDIAFDVDPVFEAAPAPASVVAVTTIPAISAAMRPAAQAPGAPTAAARD